MKRMLKSFVLALLAVLTVASLLSCVRRSGSDSRTDTEAVTWSTADDPDISSDYGSVSAADRDDGKTVICLDAGHGFGDVGCQSPYGFDEKDITIKLTKKLKAQLEKGGAAVVLTHDGETFPSVDEICSAADRLGIRYDAGKMEDNSVFSAYERSVWLNVLDAKEHFDLFVSIHVNSIENNTEINGFSLDYYEGNPSLGFMRALCGSLEEMLNEEYGKEVRVFEDNYEEAYVVNKYTNAPSVLIETGYATHEKDAADLQNEEWQDGFVSHLSDVILRYTG